MHAILVSVGTDGDVYPYVGLGAALRSRGHRVTLVTNEHFQALATENGLGFHALVSDEETGELLANPDFWHPVKAARVAAQWGVRFIGRQYELLSELAGGENVVLVASPGVFAARLVQEKLSVPMASVLLQPGLIPSVSAPPVMPWVTFPRWLPRLFVKLFWRLLDGVGAVLVGRHLNPIRASLGLKPTRRIFHEWLSPQLVIGLFPDWYAPPQADWPPRTMLAGFPMYDGRPAVGLPSEVLEFCRAGDPPVAFTFGTGMMHAKGLFQVAAEACFIFGVRGIFLTKYKHQLPAPLPPFVRHCEFAAFQELFPRCAAVVHHGGVGTVAKALAAGTPQLILPIAFDQRDNAARVKRLGAGDWLKPDRRSSAQIAKALAGLLTPLTQTRCRAVAARFGNSEALEIAARWVEELAQRAPASRRQPAA